MHQLTCEFHTTEDNDNLAQTQQRKMSFVSEESALQAISVGNSQFGQDLHNVLFEATNSNLVHSPFSLSVVLAMVKLGARGHTSLELEKVCHFPPDDVTLAEGYKKLLADISNINASSSGLVLTAANRLYAMSGFRIKSEFSAQIRQSFNGGEIQRVNFAQSEGAAAEINGWIQEVTKDKIKDLISADSLCADTRLVLVNGIYFKGLWEVPFKKSNTRRGAFHTGSQSGERVQVQVDMMWNSYEFPYTRTAHAQILELGYVGGLVSMLIFLPLELDGLPEVQGESFDHKEMNTHRTINLSLPRFKMESTHQMIDSLTGLGLVAMFDPAAADFSGICHGSGGLFVSEVVQKAFIEVNEEGTEAAAATGVIAMQESFSRPIEFMVDRPFMFQIINKPSNLVLFTGCVTNPNE